MKRVFLFLFFLLSACASTIDYSNPPSPDFPRLNIIERITVENELKLHCSPPPPGKVLLGCAEPDFTDGECFIWYYDTPAEWVKKHEHAHCRGYDHPGESTIHDDWKRWKAAHPGKKVPQ